MKMVNLLYVIVYLYYEVIWYYMFRNNILFVIKYFLVCELIWVYLIEPLKHEAHKMVKHTQTSRR